MKATIASGDFVRMSAWWAFFATVAAAGFGLWGVKENRDAEHWKTEYGIARHAAFAWKDSYMELRSAPGEVCR